jgi:hypothetical protein
MFSGRYTYGCLARIALITQETLCRARAYSVAIRVSFDMMLRQY